MSDRKQYKDKTFASINFEQEKEFEKYDEITFIGCTFKGEIDFKPTIILRFSNCKFENEWKHIICDKIVYSKCTFDVFLYSNISKTKDISKDSTLFDCTFNSIDCEGIIFDKPFIQIVDENKEKHINDISLVRCEFKDDFILNVTDGTEENDFVQIELNSIDLSHSIFHSKFKMQFCVVKNKANFHNTKFMKLADFYRTTFNEVNFYKTDFEDVSVFSESTFKEDIDFKYTKFLGYSIFRDTVIEKKLNLRNTIFDTNVNANFLDITSIKRTRSDKDFDEFIGATTSIDVANRETARVIKDFYDKSNNIIEANKFYVLEMQKMEKELSPLKNFSEWLIFKLHSISSEHSQSAYLAFLWIFNLSYLYVIYCSKKNIIDDFLALSTLLIFVLSFIDIKGVLKAGLTISLMELFAFSSVKIDVIADKINPFSIMTSWDDIPFNLLLFKVIIAYLIYQFIVSVRQNTRRK